MAEIRDEVDVETLVVQYLEHVYDELSLDVGASGRLPRGWTPAQKWARVSLLGSVDRDRGVGHVVAARVQVDLFGDNATELYPVAAASLRELRVLPSSGWSFPGAVVTDVAKGEGIVNRPDEDSDAERYQFSVILTLHPAAA